MSAIARLPVIESKMDRLEEMFSEQQKSNDARFYEIDHKIESLSTVHSDIKTLNETLNTLSDTVKSNSEVLNPIAEAWGKGITWLSRAKNYSLIFVISLIFLLIVASIIGMENATALTNFLFNTKFVI